MFTAFWTDPSLDPTSIRLLAAAIAADEPRSAAALGEAAGISRAPAARRVRDLVAAGYLYRIDREAVTFNWDHPSAAALAHILYLQLGVTVGAADHAEQFRDLDPVALHDLGLLHLLRGGFLGKGEVLLDPTRSGSSELPVVQGLTARHVEREMTRLVDEVRMWEATSATGTSLTMSRALGEIREDCVRLERVLRLAPQCLRYGWQRNASEVPGQSWIDATVLLMASTHVLKSAYDGALKEARATEVDFGAWGQYAGMLYSLLGRVHILIADYLVLDPAWQTWQASSPELLPEYDGRPVNHILADLVC